MVANSPCRTYRRHSTMHRYWLWLKPAIVLLATTLFCAASEAQSIRYTLTPRSQVVAVCADCDGGHSPAETLRGSFELTVMPLAAGSSIAALTGVEWQSETYRIRGS